MTDLESLFSSLRRAPDVEAPNLFAFDASDRLILAEASEALDAAGDGDVVVIGDRYGALTLAAAHGGAEGIRVHQDPITGEIALAHNAARAGYADRYRSLELSPALLTGARVVLLQLPRSLAELTEICDAVSRWADPEVRVFSGGRIKHMAVTMNDVLRQHFSDVQVTRASQKSRGLIASGPTPPPTPRYPVHNRIADLDLDVTAHGAVFAGDRLDIGTRALAAYVPQLPAAETIIDLGCGTGILAILLARDRPTATVIATDRSAAAVASATATAAAAGVHITVKRDDAMSAEPNASADLIVCNPPFHENATVHTGGAEKLFAAAARVLRPGGELWTVHNAHLQYRPMLGRLVGPTDTVGRTSKFVITRSRRPTGR